MSDFFRQAEKRVKNTWKEYSSSNNYKHNSQNSNLLEWANILQAIHIDLPTLTTAEGCSKPNNYEYANINGIRVEIQELVQSHLNYNLDECVNNASELLKVSDSARVFTISSIANGFYIIKRGLSMKQQIHWANTAVESYSQMEHTNLSNLRIINSDSNLPIDENILNDEKYIWKKSLDEKNNFKRFKSLRWASLGYHYNWTLRKYVRDCKTKFPEELALLCKRFANYVGDNLTAEAAIVNYYPVGTSMSGHLDDAELTMEEPIISLSIGCPAVFLIGDKTKDIEPTPLILESGDVIVMSRESRCCYHGIAIVLPHTIQDSVFHRLDTKSEYESNIIDYLKQNRVNINVRRVAPPSGEWIDKQGTGAISRAEAYS